MITTTAIGNKGEDFAATYLQNKGYDIVRRNYRYKRAEIDIIARKEGLLVFVEVKARSNLNFGFPEESVDEKKAEMVVMAANQFIYETNWDNDLRFDIISISIDGPKMEIQHFEDAFG